MSGLPDSQDRPMARQATGQTASHPLLHADLHRPQRTQAVHAAPTQDRLRRAVQRRRQREGQHLRQIERDDVGVAGAHRREVIAEVVIAELERVLPPTTRRPLSTRSSLVAAGIDAVRLVKGMATSIRLKKLVALYLPTPAVHVLASGHGTMPIKAKKIRL